MVSLKSKMQSARIVASSNVVELWNHSVTFSVNKTDFTVDLLVGYDKVGLKTTPADKPLITK